MFAKPKFLCSSPKTTHHEQRRNRNKAGACAHPSRRASPHSFPTPPLAICHGKARCPPCMALITMHWPLSQGSCNLDRSANENRIRRQCTNKYNSRRCPQRYSGWKSTENETEGDSALARLGDVSCCRWSSMCLKEMSVCHAVREAPYDMVWEVPPAVCRSTVRKSEDLLASPASLHMEPPVRQCESY